MVALLMDYDVHHKPWNLTQQLRMRIYTQHPDYLEKSDNMLLLQLTTIWEWNIQLLNEIRLLEGNGWLTILSTLVLINSSALLSFSYFISCFKIPFHEIIMYILFYIFACLLYEPVYFFLFFFLKNRVKDPHNLIETKLVNQTRWRSSYIEKENPIWMCNRVIWTIY